jgi:hypothetical protein
MVKPFDIPIFDPHHIAPGGSCGASAGARLATLGRQPRFAEWFTNSLGAGAVVRGWQGAVRKASNEMVGKPPSREDFPMKI